MTKTLSYTKPALLGGILLLAGFLWGQTATSSLTFARLANALETRIWAASVVSDIDVASTLFAVSAVPILPVMQ